MAHSFLPRVLFALHGSVPPVGSNICAIIDIGHRAFCSVSSKSHSRQCHNLPADEWRVQLGLSSIIKWIDAPPASARRSISDAPFARRVYRRRARERTSLFQPGISRKKELGRPRGHHASIPKKSKPYQSKSRKRPSPFRIRSRSISLCTRYLRSFHHHY